MRKKPSFLAECQQLEEEGNWQGRERVHAVTVRQKQKLPMEER